MFYKTLKIGILAALGIAGVSTTGQLMAGTPQVVSTIQTGPEWEPLPRAEPLTVPEVHYRVKHSPYKSELVRYGQFQFNDASWGYRVSMHAPAVITRGARRPG